MASVQEALRLISFISDLNHLVQCDSGHGWETIAGFNCLAAAETYGEECAKANGSHGLGYRLLSFPPPTMPMGEAIPRVLRKRRA